ncbi:hypothetical protein Plhal304r1_c052g0135941 [Plasmopara halstedii]
MTSVPRDETHSSLVLNGGLKESPLQVKYIKLTIKIMLCALLTQLSPRNSCIFLLAVLELISSSAFTRMSKITQIHDIGSIFTLANSDLSVVEQSKDLSVNFPFR